MCACSNDDEDDDSDEVKDDDDDSLSQSLLPKQAEKFSVDSERLLRQIPSHIITLTFSRFQ